MNILRCDLHDYLEIACTFQLKVEITQSNGEQYVCTPLTTGINKESKEEYLEVRVTGENTLIQVPVLTLKSMQALTTNPHFDVIHFER